MYANRTLETSTTTGTGDLSLAGAVTGFVAFNTSIGTNRSFAYCIEAVDGNSVPTGEWEVGNGHLYGASTLVRRMVFDSSNSDALVNFSAGTKRVFVTEAAHITRTAGQNDAGARGAAMR